MSGKVGLRVLVCGGRNFRDVELLWRVLDAVDGKAGLAFLLEIGDRAGRIAIDWAAPRDIPVQTIIGDRLSSPGLETLTSRIMSLGPPELAIGFSGGRQTAALLDLLGKSGRACANDY